MKSYPVRAPDLVVLLAYDSLCTFEYAIAVEVFALRRPGLGVPWYRTKVAAVGPARQLARDDALALRR